MQLDRLRENNWHSKMIAIYEEMKDYMPFCDQVFTYVQTLLTIHLFSSTKAATTLNLLSGSTEHLHSFLQTRTVSTSGQRECQARFLLGYHINVGDCKWPCSPWIERMLSQSFSFNWNCKDHALATI